MEEIEVKILDIDKEKIIQKLKKLGAKKIFDSYYRGLAIKSPSDKINTKDNLFGVRKKGDKSYLLFKGKKQESKAKIREEIEIEIEDYEKAKEIFKKLGFELSKERIKQRISYLLGNTRFEIDTYEGIPTFLEIEAPTVKAIEKAVKDLGYSMEDTNNWSGSEVFKHYNKEW